MNGTIATLLKTNFPWLGTEEEAGSGADVIGQLCELYRTVSRPPAPVRGKIPTVCCPNKKCSQHTVRGARDGYGFNYLEDGGIYRRVRGIENGALVVDSHYDTDDENTEDARLYCRECGEQFSLPGLEVDFR